MSYGTRKAIAGGWRSATRARENSLIMIERFNNCKTNKDIRDVLDDMKKISWFHLVDEDNEKMKAAFNAALARVEC